MTRRYIINLDRYMRAGARERTQMAERVDEFLMLLGRWAPERRAVKGREAGEGASGRSRASVGEGSVGGRPNRPAARGAS